MQAVYQTKCETERGRFAGNCWRNDQKCDEFQIAKRMFKINQIIIGKQFEHAIVMACWQKVMKIRKQLGKSYHERLSNVNFACEKLGLCEIDSVLYTT